jgi:pimeloyl-ACP methyl ester carboxylesterase
MLIQEGWVKNQKVRLHYLDSNPDDPGILLPIIFIPGALASAEVYITEIIALQPRRCIALSLRGRGKSDAPESGYSFDHHVSDIMALMKEIGLKRFCLMAYSMGVPFAIGYAIHNPNPLSGLILGDYPARYPAFPPEWVEKELLKYPHRIKKEVVCAIQRESEEVSLWDSLKFIQCPALILRGGKPGSLLRVEAVEMYRQYISNAKTVVFQDSGHELWEPDFDRFIFTIKEFLEEIDSRTKQE